MATRMSLRARLVLALGLLLLIGLGAFGFGTYARYSANERAHWTTACGPSDCSAEGQLIGVGAGLGEPETGQRRGARRGLRILQPQRGLRRAA